MRYALIMAGGLGSRLWPMSRQKLPKQLIPFIHGRSLLQIAIDRLDGLVPQEQIRVCAGVDHEKLICQTLDGMTSARFLGEPVGRDTLNAVGLSASVLLQHDPDAIIAVFTGDHIIEPVDRFQKIVQQGYQLVEDQPNTLVTFGIKPTHAATGFGYLQLGDRIDGHDAYQVDQFKEKPNTANAQQYFEAGSKKYLWNSGMFVWRAQTLMDCIARFSPENHAGLMKLGQAWDTPQRDALLAQIYPTLKKISVDFAVMEPASRDEQVQVAALPMPLTWLDVGSWPAFAQVCEHDEAGNALAAKHVMLDTCNTLVASSDPDHVIATLGCQDLVIIHTPDATLVCKADQADKMKQLYQAVGEQEGDQLL